MAKFGFENISNFIDVDNPGLTVTQVRVSTDDGNTWGVLYQPRIEVQFDYILTTAGYSVPVVEIPYNGSVTHNIHYSIYRIYGSANKKRISYGKKEYTFNYNDCHNGINTSEITVEYEGKTYDIEFNYEVELLLPYFYHVEQDGIPDLVFRPDTYSNHITSVVIPYTVSKVDKETNVVLETYKTGTVTSNSYSYDDVVDTYDYDEKSYFIAFVYESKTVVVDGEEYSFEATIRLCNADYINMVTCSAPNCNWEYDSNSNDVCPHCYGEGFPDSDDDEITIESYDVYYDEGDATLTGDGDYEVTFNMSDGDTYTKWIRELDTTKYSDGTVRVDITFTYEGQTFNEEVILGRWK